MNEFSEGWYEVRFDPRTRDRRCAYFKTPTLCIAECTLKASGLQVLPWASAQGKATAWAPQYRRLSTVPQGDWWDPAPDTGPLRPELPGAHSRANRQLTPRELCQRAAAADPNQADGLSCSREIHVGLFFDGTNNNMERDRADQSHSNVASLYDAHKEDKKENFRYYMPGVGTRFPEIGEDRESDDGKTFASGGEARIHWAMLQVYNAVHSSYHVADLMPLDEMKRLCTSTAGLATAWRLGDGKMTSIFANIQRRLLAAIANRRPRITKVHLSVFGFSRGAAEARTFCRWIQEASGMQVGEADMEIRFLGLFDTVASVGLADSSPVGRGFLDWADGTMDIHGVQRVVHYVAAHEIRQSFPLSTARIGGLSYPAGTKEYVYPGAHSDLGGGYAPKSQGKGMAGRSSLLSQIPLLDMYFEALKAGVRLDAKAEMLPRTKADFTVEPELDQAFSVYANWTQDEEKSNVASDGGPPVEDRMRRHMWMYWRWRAAVGSGDSRFAALSSYRNASRQDQIDLWESEQDWRKDIQRAREAARHKTYGTTVPTTTAEQQALLREIGAAKSVPAAVSAFFDQHVHDSHAGFWMLGPITKQGRTDFVAAIKQKKITHDRLMQLASSSNANAMVRRDMQMLALSYELNSFERRVVDADAQAPGNLPLMTDGDAADLRSNSGIRVTAGLAVLGTKTRREPFGHGHYRRVFDKS